MRSVCGDLQRLAEKLGGGGLVETDAGAERPDRFENGGDADRVDLPGMHRLLERGPDIALPGEIVDLVDPRALDHAQRAAEFLQLEIDDLDIAGDAELLQAPEIGGGDVAHRPDHRMALLQQQLCEIGAVLPVDACNERPLRHANSDSTIVVIVALCGRTEQGTP